MTSVVQAKSNPKTMSKNSNTEPQKGILKKLSNPLPPTGLTPTTQSASSGSNSTGAKTSQGHTHFDELNLQQTLHPADKDYGFDKIDEAKTPFHEYEEPEDETKQKRGSFEMASTSGPIDASALSKLLLQKATQPPKSADNRAETPDKPASDFEAKRKAHYDEFKKVKDNKTK